MVGAPKAWERHWEIIDRVGLPEFTPDPKLLTDVMFRAGVAPPPSPSQLRQSAKAPSSGAGASLSGAATTGGMGQPASAGAGVLAGSGGDPGRQRRQVPGGPTQQPGIQNRKLRSGLVKQPLNRSAHPHPHPQQHHHHQAAAEETAAAAAAAANLQYRLYLQQHAWMGGVEGAEEGAEAEAVAAVAVAAAGGLQGAGGRPHTAPSVPRLQLGALHQPAGLEGSVGAGSLTTGWESAAAAALADGSVASSQAQMGNGLVGPSAAAWAAAEQSAARAAAAAGTRSAAKAPQDEDSEAADSGVADGVIRGLSLVPQPAVSPRKDPHEAQQVAGGRPGEAAGGGSTAQVAYPLSARGPGARQVGSGTSRASAPSVSANTNVNAAAAGGALSLRLSSARPTAPGRGGSALQAQPSSGAALSTAFSVAAPGFAAGAIMTPTAVAAAAVPLPAMPSVYMPSPSAIPPRERYRGILERVGRMAEHSRQERRRRRTGARAAAAGSGGIRRRPNTATASSAAGGTGDADGAEDSSPDSSPRGLGGWAGRWKAPLAQYTDSAVVQAGGLAAAAVSAPGSASARRRAADEEAAAEAARALGPEEHAVWQLTRALDELGRFSCLDAVAGHTSGMTDGSVLAEVDARIAAMQRQNQLAQAAWGPGGTRRRGLLPPPPPAFPVAAARAYGTSWRGLCNAARLQVLVGREGGDLRQAAADVLASMGAASPPPPPPQHPQSQPQSRYPSPGTSFKLASGAVAAAFGGSPAGGSPPSAPSRSASTSGARHASGGGAPPSRMSSNGAGGAWSGAPPGTAAARIRAGSSMRSLKVSFSKLSPELVATALAEDDEEDGKSAPAVAAGGSGAAGSDGVRPSAAAALDPSANPYPSLTSPGNSDTAAYVDSLLSLPGLPRGQAGLPLQGRTSLGGNTAFGLVGHGGPMPGSGEGSASVLHPMQSAFFGRMSVSGVGGGSGAAAFISPAATSRGGGATTSGAGGGGGGGGGGGLLTSSSGLDQAWALLESLMIQLHDSHAARADLVAGVEADQQQQQQQLGSGGVAGGGPGKGGSVVAGGAKTPRIGGTPAGGGLSAAAAMAAASASGVGGGGGSGGGAQFRGRSAVDRLVSLMDTTLQLGGGGGGGVEGAGAAAGGAGQGRAGNGSGAGGRLETAEEVAAAAAAPQLARNALRAAVAAALQPGHTEQVLYFITRLALMLLLGELAWLLALLRASGGAGSPHLAALAAALRGYEGQRAHAATLAAAAERLELALEDAADRAAHAEHQLSSLQSLLQHAGSDVADLTLHTRELEAELEAARARISLLEESLAEAEGDFDRVEAVAERRAGAALGAARALGGELLAASLARVEARSVEVQVASEGDASDPRALPPALAAGRDQYYPLTPTGSMRGHGTGAGAGAGAGGGSVRRSGSSRPGAAAGADGGGGRGGLPSKRGGKPGSPKRQRGSGAAAAAAGATSRLAVVTSMPMSAAAAAAAAGPAGGGLHGLELLDEAGSEPDACSTPGASIAGESEPGGEELIYTHAPGHTSGDGGQQQQQQQQQYQPYQPYQPQPGLRSPLGGGSGGGGLRPQSAAHHLARQGAGSGGSGGGGGGGSGGSSPPRRSRLGPRRSSGTGDEGPGPGLSSPPHNRTAAGAGGPRARRSSEGEQRGGVTLQPHSPPQAGRGRHATPAASAVGGHAAGSKPDSSSGETGPAGSRPASTDELCRRALA